MLEKLSGAKFFSKIDLKMGYHQIELHPDSRHITTFSSSKGTFQYKRLVLGISSAFEDYQDIISNLFRNASNMGNIADDIIVWGATFEEHNNSLDKCLSILEENRLTVNCSTCLFAQP